MPNYCNNSLTIKGDAKSMHEFYEFVGPLEQNFSMQNLCPIPKEIENTISPIGFRPEGTKEVKLASGQIMQLKVNRFNQTEQEYIEHNKYLNKKYGYDNWYDWCNSNWGCKWEMDDICIGEQTDEKVFISYATAWVPNSDFISFLGEKFPKLEFELEYYEPMDELAGILYVQDETCYDSEIPINKVVFAKNDDDEHYTFFDFYNEDDEDEYENFDDYEIVDILGSKWEEAISYSDYNKENVTNWSAFEEYINTTIE